MHGLVGLAWTILLAAAFLVPDGMGHAEANADLIIAPDPEEQQHLTNIKGCKHTIAENPID